MICRYTTKSFIEIPPCAKKVIFITEFAIWCKKNPFYKVKKIFQKRLCEWRNFRNIFSRPLFIIIFKPKMVSNLRKNFFVYCLAPETYSALSQEVPISYFFFWIAQFDCYQVILSSMPSQFHCLFINQRLKVKPLPICYQQETSNIDQARHQTPQI